MPRKNHARFIPSRKRKTTLLEAPAEFKRIAQQGGIHAVGRLNGVGQHIPIPDTYWMSATLTPLRDGMNLVAKEYVAAQAPENPEFSSYRNSLARPMN
jgi:hypothetical protein